MYLQCRHRSSSRYCCAVVRGAVIHSARRCSTQTVPLTAASHTARRAHNDAPRRRLLPAFDNTLLYGYAHGTPAYFAEPLDCWLAVLADAVPLYRDAIVLCPSTLPRARVQALTQRAEQHLPSVRVMPLTPRRSSQPLSHTAAAAPAGTAAHARVDKAQTTTTTTALTTSASSNSSTALTLSSPPLPALASPLEAMPSASLDVVVFADNLFADEVMTADVAWHVSQAHRVLRPHGVLALVGYAPHVRVAAPSWAADDADDCLRELLHRARRVEEAAAAAAMARKGACGDACRLHASCAQQRRQRQLHAQLQRARVCAASAGVAHADVYLPFRAVRRRVYCGEYALTPAQLTACYRALPSYALLAHAATQHDEAMALASSSSLSSRVADVDGNDDFVRVPNDAIDSGGDGSNNKEDDEEDDTAVYVRRHAYAIDPLEALEHCLAARLAAEHSNNSSSSSSSPCRGSVRADDGSCVRVRVQHFTVTCSNRSINTAVPSYALPSARDTTTPPRLRR